MGSSEKLISQIAFLEDILNNEFGRPGMFKKLLYLGCLLILLFSALYPLQDKLGGNTEEGQLAVAKGVHKRVLTLDAHVDIEVSFITPELYQNKHHEKLFSYPDMEKGGMDAVFFAVYTAQGPRSQDDFERAYKQAVEKYQAIHSAIKEKYSTKITIAYHSAEVHKLYNEGNKIAIIGMENGYPLGKDLANVKRFYDLGCRYITLCHNGHNQLCDSHQNGDGPPSEHNGVSVFGEKVIAEMNRLGIIVDISHLSKKSMLDVVKLSKAPIIASHSCCRTLCDVSRNLYDDQLLALKENGGVIHLVAINDYVKPDPPVKRRSLEHLRKELGFPQEEMKFLQIYVNSSDAKKKSYQERAAKINQQYPAANVKDFVDQIEYAIKLIGIDHVGISSDFYESPYCIEGWKDVGETFNITLELIRRGYSEADIEKIWSGNLLRVWREVEKTAASLKMINLPNSR